ncbi:nitrilase-related carbon-nitrogen hydrolase [Persicimonas caeni]|uniref:nitrilase-related carbon-nitrogen hydrolase n=1 Tax=Persicimonas caeni TaxID=2292766 RepID=UPI00143D8878|nr:nitrilase-related carbon-nitrogen hydrolase [Persicimonas caeni]
MLTAISGMRYNVALAGWIGSVPWLIYLRHTDGWKSRLVFAGVLQVAAFLAVLKIVTEPLPWFFALMFSVPSAVMSAVLYVLFEWLRRRAGDRWGLAIFPALVIVSEWASSGFSEMGSWGALAYTQIDNLALMQTTSLFGLSGVTGLLGLTSAIIAVALAEPDARWWRRPAAVLAAVIFLAHGWGVFRLFQPLEGPIVRIGTVVSDLRLGPDAPPDDAELARATNTLFERTEIAAERGADLIVWNEGATSVDADDEAALLERGHQLARLHDVDIIMAYVVPREGMEQFENKFTWMTPEGGIEDYLKHHPVPGEGSIKGDAPFVAHDRPYGRAAGAICYDYDFPSIGLQHARLGVDLAVVPSSDWEGIDPYHTEMAAVRGIEGGFAVARSVRHATSAVFDAHGVARGRARDREGVHVMVTAVPVEGQRTLYSMTGDLLPLLAGLVVLSGGVIAFRRRNN